MNFSRVILGLCAAMALWPLAPLWAQKGGPPMAYSIPQWSAEPNNASVAVPPPPLPVYASLQEEIIVPDGIPDGTQPYWNGGPPGAYEACEPGCECPPVVCESGPMLRHVLGAEYFFSQPLNEPKQKVELTDLVTEKTYSASADPECDDGFRLWWGMEYGWLGYRLRYTHIGNDSVAGDPNFGPNANHAFHSAYQLEADLIDFEMTQWYCCHNHVVDFSVGVRYAQLERGGTVIGYGTLGNEVELFGVATAANDLEGAGLTFSVGTTSCCHGGWHCFWNFRGSYLWADQSAFALTKANAVVQPPIGSGIADSQDSAFVSSDDSETVWIGELQLGIQYQQALCCAPCCAPVNFYFRIALEYQYWDTGDLLAFSNSFAFLEGGPPAFGGDVESTAHAHDGNLDLLGISLGAGVSF